MEEKIIRVYCSFNMGDLIASLSGLKKVCDETNSKLVIFCRLDLPMGNYYESQKHPTQDTNGQAVGMNRKMFDMLKPLLESQYYIKEFRVFDGETSFDYNLENSRKFSLLPLPAGQLQTWDSFTYPELACDLSKPWIEFDYKYWYEKNEHNQSVPIKRSIENKILWNRTERYTNPYITYNFLKQYSKDILFIGTVKEHEIACAQWGIDIQYLPIVDFLDLALCLGSCKFFIGNASFCWHLANAMGVPRILEFCREFPNSSPTGANGYQFLKQEALIYYFNKLNQ